MAVHYTHRQSYVPPINRPHAVDRWHERTPAEISITDAWKTAVPVRAPETDADDVRLYAPYDILLIVRAGLLRTELHSDHRTDLSGLLPCTACGDPVDPVLTERCPWCDAAVDELGHGRVQVSWGGGSQ